MVQFLACTPPCACYVYAINDITKLSFEEAIKTLTDIVTKIEQGQIPLEQSLDQYEKGMGLIRHCRASCRMPRSV